MFSPIPKDAKLVFQGQFASAYQWPQTMFDGSIRTFERYVRCDGTAIIPFLDKDTVLLTKQEQPGRDPFWDVPGGRVDPGEENEASALRELQEETSYRAKTHELWLLRQHQGMVAFQHGIYLAKDLEPSPSDHQEKGGERITLVPTKWNDLIQICLEHKLRQWDVMLVILSMHYHAPDRERLQAFLDRKN